MKQYACTIKEKTESFEKPNIQKKLLEKKVIVVDVFGDPIPAVHVLGAVAKTITNAKGEAIIQSNGIDSITFSHVGKVTQKIPFDKLGSKIILEDDIEDLGEVIIEAVKPKKDNLWIWVLGVGAVGMYLWTKNSKKKNAPKPVTL